MSGKKDKASAEDLHVMDTVEQYESYEDYLDSQVRYFAVHCCVWNGVGGGCCALSSSLAALFSTWSSPSRTLVLFHSHAKTVRRLLSMAWWCDEYVDTHTHTHILFNLP